MLPKIDEVSDADEVSDLDEIIEEEIEELEEDVVVDEIEEDDVDEEIEEELWEDEEIERKPVAMQQLFRRSRLEKKIVRYEGSPLHSEPDSDIE